MEDVQSFKVGGDETRELELGAGCFSVRIASQGANAPALSCFGP